MTRTQDRSSLGRRCNFATPSALLLTLAIAAVPVSGQGPLQRVSAAQTASIPKQAFEVASIRPFDPSASPSNPGQAQLFPSNRLTARITDVELLISEAFGVAGGEIAGGPDWINTQFYSVDARLRATRFSPENR